MARFCPLFSSSSGNCTYIGSASGGILIDAGVSAKRIVEALDGIGVGIQSFSVKHFSISKFILFIEFISGSNIF